MKLGQICFNDILDEFENGSGLLKNMATRGACNLSLYGYIKILLALLKLHL